MLKDSILPNIYQKIKATVINWLLCNIGIIPEVKLVPEAQPRDTNGRVVLFPLSTLGRKHILMAQSVAEGPNF